MKKITCHIVFILISIASTIAQKQDSLFAIINDTQSDSLKAISFYGIGKIQRDKDSSLFYYHKALSIADQANGFYVKGIAANAIASTQFHKNELDTAIFYWILSKRTLIQALEEYDIQIIEEQLAETQYNLALGYYYEGNTQKIIENIHASLAINLKFIDNNKTIRCYNILGIVHIGEDEYEKAKKYFSDGLGIALDLKDTVQISSMLSNLAISHNELKEYEKALDYFQESLKLTMGKSLSVDLATKSNIGAVYRQLKEYEKAKLYLEECVKGFDKLDDYRGKIISLNLLGDLYLDTHSWEKLLSVSKRSMQLLEEVPILEQKRYATYNLSKAYENLDNTKEAFRYYKLHTALKDSMFNEQKSKQIEKLEAEFEFEKNQREISQLTEENLIKEVQIAEEKNVKYALVGFIGFVFLGFIVLILGIKRKQDKKRHRLALMKAEIEQRMLRSQMNPHFIFNALNSIQSYITTNHTYEAEVFLSKFSMLIRNILENSTHEYISLEDEINTLKLYLELEKLRFDDKFDFSIDDQLLDSGIQVPPMLIQPFIENAILHGMKGKTTKGHIIVRFSDINDDMVLCEIEDDGVGRDATSINEKGHKSLALKLINDRISFFNQDVKGKFDMSIEDLRDNKGNPSGTKVNLQMPVNY